MATDKELLKLQNAFLTLYEAGYAPKLQEILMHTFT
jgi:hypothetical protein